MLHFDCAKTAMVNSGVVTGAIAGAVLFCAPGSVIAEPTDPAPASPNCTAADLAGVSAGVAAATSAYLFTHPEVNDYFTSLKGQERSDFADELQDYMNAHPQVHADLQGIRQPLTDLQDRCSQ
jgi:hemophore-related protein